MPPKHDKKEVKEDNLTAVVVVDSFDRRFSPITSRNTPWCLQKICNVPVIHYTLSWIARTGCKNVILVVSKKNAETLGQSCIEREWKYCFADFSIIPCGEAMSVGDAIRHLESTGKLHGDFLLVSNPATIIRSDLKQQIARFKELRKADKAKNVMTLIYSSLENINQEVIAVSKDTNKLRLYHREDDVSRLEVDKKAFIDEFVVRRDISDTGIALCALNIAAQFSDNFDFQHIDNVIRELLVNEEILDQSIHVDVLPVQEPAICIIDYDTLLFAQALLMEHWFFPLGPDRMPSLNGYSNVEINNNTYIATPDKTKAIGGTPNFPIFNGHNVCVGQDYVVGKNVVMVNVVFGDNVTIGSDCELANCAIGDGCNIGKKCRLSNVVLGNNVSIPDNTSLLEQSIIGNEVSYPTGFELTHNFALCKSNPEDDDSMLQSEEKDDLYLWRLTTSRSFWRYGGRKQITRDTDYNDDPDGVSSSSDSESEGDEDVEVDPNLVFLDEITDSMQRIQSLDFDPELMKNLVLEINSSRLANNIAVDNLGKYVFFAFCGLDGNQTVASFTKLAKQWTPMFKNFYKDTRSQVQLLLGLEEKHKASPDLFTVARCTKTVLVLYEDLDIIEEEAIFEWFKSLPSESPLKSAMTPVIKWLEESDEESEDE